MDTHSKTNVEFRNEVNEALARHELSFDQMNSVLQAVLIELQTLRTSRNQNPNSSDINPFAPEGSSHPHTSRSLTSNGQPQHHLKLSFPRFDGNDPTGWVYKAEQYFDFKDIAPAQQVQLASFHVEGIALQWHRWLNKLRGPLTWGEFIKAMLLCFGPTEYEDPSESLTRLQDDIRIDIKIKQPHTLANAIGVTRLIEERNQLQKKPSPPARSSPTMMAPRAPTNLATSILGPPPFQRTNPPPTSFHRITNQEA
ncbi:hypothetical protein F0562_025200 [Nyssa sinensis]|uniref:Retrotransposon gag domain-containing protein n=1 Tax=Nyssa sinensis TaxID=561372 RepID=A0A5J5BDN4_9ASTE|nr:hypothetical protein F0562_025200 [Nyssa sinensis]